MTQPGFWDDNQSAQDTLKELNSAKSLRDTLSSIESKIQELEMGLELFELEEDPDLFNELVEISQSLKNELDSYQLTRLLSGEYDKLDAILEIHSGSGGTESQDWAAMLLRMYQRWADQNGFQVEMVSYSPGEEAGIKSVTLEIKGDYAYGYLRSEKGVHRLVRISPFDSNSRRHTSFSSVEVTPMIDSSIEVEIDPSDLRIDTYRASGAGGQHVNVTDSAVRITHIPTGITVQSQSQRSQLQNREQAMDHLRARLFQKQEEEKAAEIAAIQGEQKEITWGSQIRSYVFHPYSMVKDHRTNYEVGNTDAVMDGDLNGFIEAFLAWDASGNNTNS